jgi:hypothetical protein
MMNSANLPSQGDLNGLYGDWNPLSYMEGQKNQDLAAQFRDQAYTNNNQTIASEQQKIDQANLMNPLEVASKKLTNEDQGYKNTIQGVASRRASANEQNVLSEDLRAHAIKMTDDDFHQADQSIESLLRSGEPDKVTLGLKLQSTLPTMLAEKRKNDQAKEVKRLENDGSLATAQEHSRGNLAVTNANIEGGRWNRVPKVNSNSLLIKFQSMPPATRLGVTWSAINTGINPFTQQPMTEDEMKQFQAVHDQDQATVDASNQSRSGGAAGIVPQAKPGGGIEITNKPAATVAPKGQAKGTADDPIVLK